MAQAKGADLLIEAVFEDPALKHQVYAEVEPLLAPDALLGSNTSTLPITALATGVSRPEDFIGLHFFSPVDKMPLLEIVVGDQTSDEAIAKAIDVAQQIKKTPIVVNDSRGFFTSRVIGTFIGEAVAMLAEGVAGNSIEQAALQAGYPTGPLALYDEVSLTLGRRIREAARDAAAQEGLPFAEHPSFPVIDRMVVEFDRGGRAAGRRLLRLRRRQAVGPVAGAGGALRRLDGARVDLAELSDRMLFIEADRVAAMPRRGRAALRPGGQHRLDLRDRVSRRGPAGCSSSSMATPAAGRRSWSAPERWRQSTAPGSSRPPRCPPRPEAARLKQPRGAIPR